MELGLDGRRALVTGAAGGIGRAVAAALAGEGVLIAVLDRDADAVADAAASLLERGAAASAFVADISDEAEVRDGVRRAVEWLGGLDVVVSCAGISGPVGTPLADTDLADWQRVFAVNVTGAFLVLTHAIPALRASDAASVVFVASDSALATAPGMAPYGASKAAVLQLARAAAVELAPERIRVNAVCPSIVDTPMSRGDLGLDDGFGEVGYPVQTAAEVAAQVVFLSSPLARPVNAAALISDFGFLARSHFPA